MSSDKPLSNPLPPGIDSRNVLDFDPPPPLRKAVSIILGWQEEAILLRSRIIIVQRFSTPLALFLTMILLAIHFVWALHSKCSVNFQRAGADISFVAAGISALTTWYSVPNGGLDGGGAPKFSWRNPNVALPLIAGIGTLVWGYGDLFTSFGMACNDPSPAMQVQSLLETRLSLLQR